MLRAFRDRRDWGAIAFVAGVWLFFVYYLVDFFREFCVDCPYFDDWENIPALVGEQPITLKWLWSQHNEHRIFIPRLINLALGRMTHGDFRAGCVFNMILLAVLAIVLVLAARKMRGHTEFTDAIFPVLLLTWGQAENLFWSFQVQFVSSAALSVAFLVLSVRSSRLTRASGLGLGACGLLLPLVGGSGVALAPAVGAAVALAGWTEWRRAPGGRRRALELWALGLLAVALTAFYFVDYARPEKHPPSHSAKATYEAAVQFLSASVGQAAKYLWPESKKVVLLGTAGTLAMLAWVACFVQAQRERALRVMLVLGGFLCLAVGIGWARAAQYEGIMFAPRYPTLAAPFLCAVYLAWEVPNLPRIRKLVQTGILFCAASVVYWNFYAGRGSADGNRGKKQGLVDDVRAGMPLAEVVHRHGHLYYGGDALMSERLRMLHARSIGVFRYLKE